MGLENVKKITMGNVVTNPYIECYNTILEADRTRLYEIEAKKFLEQPFSL
ncbi:MAG: hypothetical protein HGN29_08360 [Asgard group archaeon]|nr:hypothetical protein [Asgard group archaeon]